MSSNKKYYWLKLNENFFDEDTILWLEEQENGKDYVIFYLKLCLKSLQDDGKLIRYVGEKLIPYDVKALGNLTNTPVDTVAVAMKTFIEIGLVDRLETGEIYLTQINELIGSETEVAKRVRKHRAKQALIEQQSGGLLQSNNDVTKSNTDIEIEKDIDIEIEKDIDIEIEKDILSDKVEPPIPYKEITDYLNQKAETNYRHTGKKTQTLIKARYSEGFNLDDFKKVIDIKVNEWLNDKSMNKYLRPETLFGTKFESYLNQKQKTRSSGYDTSEYDDLY